MLSRVLEPEVMDTPEEARAYDGMDHAAVNRAFVADFLAFCPAPAGDVLDVGTGTALIPVELCRAAGGFGVVAADAAGHMLAVAAVNVRRAGLAGRVRLDAANARALPYPGGAFRAVLANSLHHHVPDPFDVFSEMVRVCGPGGALFARDLLRPADEPALAGLVAAYAGRADPRQRRLFADSLRASLTLAEVQCLVSQVGFPPATVRQTSDRHWTWAAVAG